MHGAAWFTWLAFLAPVLQASDPCSSLCKDPHLTFAYGGRADFRGRNGTVYNFMSSNAAVLNIRTRDAVFKLGRLTVHGSFMTDVYVVIRTPNGRFFNITYSSGNLNEFHWAWHMIQGSCAKAGNRVPFELGPHAEKHCDDSRITTDMSSTLIESREWTIRIRGKPVYDRIDGPRHRLDISLGARVARDDFAAPPHGIVGASFASGVPTFGRIDHYPPRNVEGEFWTTAMAEGALEGRAEDYELDSKLAIDTLD